MFITNNPDAALEVFWVGIFCIAFIAIGFPLWVYSEVAKMHRSFHILSEDISGLESDIREVKDKLTLLLHTESVQNKIQLLKGNAETITTEIQALKEQINMLLTQSPEPKNNQ